MRQPRVPEDCQGYVLNFLRDIIPFSPRDPAGRLLVTQSEDLRLESPFRLKAFCMDARDEFEKWMQRVPVNKDFNYFFVPVRAVERRCKFVLEDTRTIWVNIFYGPYEAYKFAGQALFAFRDILNRCKIDRPQFEMLFDDRITFYWVFDRVICDGHGEESFFSISDRIRSVLKSHGLFCEHTGAFNSPYEKLFQRLPIFEDYKDPKPIDLKVFMVRL